MPDPTRYYFAARYSRNAELRGYRDELTAAVPDAEVTSRWIDQHGGELAVSYTPEALAADPDACWKHGQADLEDLANADAIVSFTGKGKAPEQRASYKREFGNFVAKRVDPNLIGSLNDAFADHDPLANVDAATGQVKAPDTKPLVAEVRSNVEARIGADVDVQSVVFGFIRYDAETQKSIEAYQQKILANKNLLQDEKNAQVAKRITETNAKVDAVTRCLEIAAQHGKEPGLCLGGANPVQVTNR